MTPWGLELIGIGEEGNPLHRWKFQDKELEDALGLFWMDFGARHYDAALGRWHAVDPADQFASPYTGMANNPVMSVDPDGRLAWFVPIIIGAVIGGMSQGIAASNNGGTFMGGFWRGALVGAAAGATGIGVSAWAAGAAFTAVGSGAASVGFGGALLGGIAGGAVSGGLGAALNGGNIGTGLWQGALGGAIGSVIGMNAPGILTGALAGAASGGLAGGLTAALTGGDFGQGFINGAISGAITGGIYGGIAAAESRYERNLLFGNVTKQGKQDFVNDLAAQLNAAGHGVRSATLSDNLADNENAVTRAVINGREVDLITAYDNGAGTESNIYLKYKGKSLRAIESTFRHELVHAKDLNSGYAGAFFNLTNRNIHATRMHLELRGYMTNLNFGYRQSYYRNLIRQTWLPNR